MNLCQRVKFGYRYLQNAIGDHAGQLSYHIGARCFGVPLSLDSMLLDRCEVYDGINTLGLYAELHVARAEGIYKGVHSSARRLPDALGLAFTVYR